MNRFACFFETGNERCKNGRQKLATVGATLRRCKNKVIIRIERKSRKETDRLVVVSVEVDRSLLRSEALCPLCLKTRGKKNREIKGGPSHTREFAGVCVSHVSGLG